MLRVVAIIVDEEDNVCEYRFLNEDTSEVQDLSMLESMDIISKGVCSNIKIASEGRDLICIDCDIDKLPIVRKGTDIVDNDKVIIVGVTKLVGEDIYKVTDYSGVVMYLTKKDILNYARKVGLTNGQVVSVGDEYTVVGLKKDLPVYSLYNYKIDVVGSKV